MSRINNKSDIDKFVPNSDQTLLFDTNILIKLLYPIDFNGDVDKYTILFEKIKKAKANHGFIRIRDEKVSREANG